MPHRPVPPPLSLSSHPPYKHAYRPQNPSRLSQPPAQTSPRTPPLIPPPRLHLRTILPSPPASPSKLGVAPTTATSRAGIAFALPPQPKEPYPWIWRCHVCQTKYALGVTRRCLQDGHYFCSFVEPAIVDGRGRGKEKGKKKKTKSCRAEFDYTGWEAWNSWQVEVDKVKGGRRGVRNFGQEAHLEKDCWHECTFPSQCLAAMRDKAMRDKDEKEKVSSDIVLDPALNLAGALRYFTDTAPSTSPSSTVASTPSCSILSPSPAEPLVPESEAWINLVSSPKVWDGEGAAQQQRKRSLQKTQQISGIALKMDISLVAPLEAPESPPSSPLKMFCESVDWDGEDGDVVMSDGISDEDEEKLLKELYRAGNAFLSSFARESL